jgi:hypothetical protein
MLPNLLGGFFRQRCPLCKVEIQRGGEGVVRRLGKLFCSQSHADTYDCNLYQALHDLQRQHASRHGDHALSLVTSSLDCEASEASQGGTQGRVCYGTWFALRRIPSSPWT